MFFLLFLFFLLFFEREDCGVEVFLSWDFSVEVGGERGGEERRGEVRRGLDWSGEVRRGEVR